MTSSAPAPVLLVGLGAMGGPMARRIAAAGRPLVLHDADRGRGEALAAETGATFVPTLDQTGLGRAGLPTRAAAPTSTGAAPTAVLMLPDSDAVTAVLPRLLDALPAGSLVIDMGSSQPASTVALAEEAARHGVTLVDAPVSGGVARAQTGELSIMFGGPAEVLERCRGLLELLGGEIVPTGAVGSGHAMKALNNLCSAIGLVAASEVLAIGGRFGLDPQVMLRVLNHSTGRNHATEVKFERFVLSQAFDSGFGLKLMVKDLNTALGLAAGTGTAAPLSTSCLQTWADALRLLGDGADHTEIATYVQHVADGQAG